MMAEEILEKLKKERTRCRTSFTNYKKKVEIELNNNPINYDSLTETFNVFELKAKKLTDIDMKISPYLSVEHKDYDSEMESIEDYEDNFVIIKTKFERVLKIGEAKDTMPSRKTEEVKIKLPKLSLPQFNGDLRNFVGFWAQFKKIHNDVNLSEDDKFQYLLQSTVVDSPARQLIESFPPSGAYYKDVVEQFKNRFGQEDMLIEIYMRDLLSLVLEQQSPKEKQMSLRSLYDKLESQLRCLGTLGVNSDKYSVMLYPLVESAIPEDTLRAWQRNSLSGDSSKVAGDRLSNLLLFLRSEVESEERLLLARSSFKKTVNLRSRQRSKSPQPNLPSAAVLSAIQYKKVGEIDVKRAAKKEVTCAFCSKNHLTKDCLGKSKELSLDQKLKLLTSKNLCFVCLENSSHRAKQCRVFVKCLLCSKRHYAVMCSQLNTFSKPKFNQEDITSDVNCCNLAQVPRGTVLPTLLVHLEGEKKDKIVRLLLDTGAQRSYVSNKVIEELGLVKIREETLCQTVFGGIKIKNKNYGVYSLNICSVTGDKESLKIMALGYDRICPKIPCLSSKDALKKLKEKGIELIDAGHEPKEIDILVGADFFGKMLTGKIVEINNTLTAVETRFGWTVMGQGNPPLNENMALLMVNELNLDVPNLWRLDAIGITDPVDIEKKEVAKETMKHFGETITMNREKRYEVRLPWLAGHPTLENNRQEAEKRLENVTRKIRRDGIYEEYDKVFRSWLSEGIIEEAREPFHDGKINYLAHRAVVKQSHTTKVRPVFDASAKDKNGNSLNSCLATGPNLLEIIPSLIIDFRKERIGVSADIKQAFLQLSLQNVDRDHLRFLWWDEKGEQIIEFRHCRVVFGLTCSPFLLEASIGYHLKLAHPESKHTAEKLLKSFYMDNCVTSVSDEEALGKFVIESKALMNTAKMELRAWAYNSEWGKEHLDVYAEHEIVSILGMRWNKKLDTLSCNLDRLNLTETKITKRVLLSLAQQVFDPLGVTSPVSLLPKLWLQEAWKNKIDWDKTLTRDVQDKVIDWVESLTYLKECEIPRCLFGTTGLQGVKEIELHVFVDACKSAYAACIFIRSVDQNEKVIVNFVMAKTRVAPIKEISMPRLELLAAVIGARLFHHINKVLNIPQLSSWFWTDSEIVLAWIRRDDSWNTFVANRCREIRRLTGRENWRHLPGNSNVSADMASRGVTGKQFLDNRWWEGPKWLHEDKSMWPLSNPDPPEEIVLSEKKMCVVVSSNCSVISESYFKNISDYFKIVKVLAWMLKFKNIVLNGHLRGHLSINDIEDAEILLIKLIQNDCFKTKERLRELASLNVFKDETGVLRVKTKLILGDFDCDFRYPIVLPSDHEVVKKLIVSTHKKEGHAGVLTLMTKLRERFWILRSRRTVRKAISGCIRCKRFASKPAITPFAPLPRNRILTNAAFSTTGVDTAGPLYLKGGSKVWVLLFTCATYRAVHLELIESLSTNAFIEALSRFIARRGRVTTIYCDNGTNFVGATRLLSKLDWNAILQEAAVRRIKFIMNAPAAPWWGGWWERLIRVMKDLLKRNLGRQAATFTEMMTILCDCEATINSRPLTYISENPEELAPLTPSCFITDIGEHPVPDLDLLGAKGFNKRLKHIQTVKSKLRMRFQKEYLACLRHRGREGRVALNIGDIVLIGSDNKKRLSWPLGKIIALFPGRDGAPRTAKLKTAEGELVRPFGRLYPLEVQDKASEEEEPEA